MKKTILIISILLCAIISKAQINLDSSLVLYYPFNGNANDSSVNHINGTLMNGPTYTTDHLDNPNSALLFDGIDDYVLSDSSLILDSLVEPFTITAWIRIDDWYTGIWAPMISKSNFSNVQFRIVMANNSTYWLAPFSTCGALQGVNLPPVNSWFYLTLIQDLNNIYIYIDGTLTNSFTCSDLIVTNNSPMTVGNDPHGDNEYFNGAIDEVRIYKRLLLPDEVNVLTGLNSISSTKNKINIFPNPVSSVLNFQISGSMKKNTSLAIINMLGEPVLETFLKDQITTLDVSKLSRGTYIIKLQNEDESYVHKFVKE